MNERESPGKEYIREKISLCDVQAIPPKWVGATHADGDALVV